MAADRCLFCLRVFETGDAETDTQKVKRESKRAARCTKCRSFQRQKCSAMSSTLKELKTYIQGDFAKYRDELQVYEAMQNDNMVRDEGDMESGTPNKKRSRKRFASTSYENASLSDLLAREEAALAFLRAESIAPRDNCESLNAYKGALESCLALTETSDAVTASIDFATGMSANTSLPLLVNARKALRRVLAVLDVLATHADKERNHVALERGFADIAELGVRTNAKAVAHILAERQSKKLLANEKYSELWQVLTKLDTAARKPLLREILVSSFQSPSCEACASSLLGHAKAKTSCIEDDEEFSAFFTHARVLAAPQEASTETLREALNYANATILPDATISEGGGILQTCWSSFARGCELKVRGAEVFALLLQDEVSEKNALEIFTAAPFLQEASTPECEQDILAWLVHAEAINKLKLLSSCNYKRRQQDIMLELDDARVKVLRSWIAMRDEKCDTMLQKDSSLEPSRLFLSEIERAKQAVEGNGRATPSTETEHGSDLDRIARLLAAPIGQGSAIVPEPQPLADTAGSFPIIPPGLQVSEESNDEAMPILRESEAQALLHNAVDQQALQVHRQYWQLCLKAKVWIATMTSAQIGDWRRTIGQAAEFLETRFPTDLQEAFDKCMEAMLLWAGADMHDLLRKRKNHILPPSYAEDKWVEFASAMKAQPLLRREIDTLTQYRDQVLHQTMGKHTIPIHVASVRWEDVYFLQQGELTLKWQDLGSAHLGASVEKTIEQLIGFSVEERRTTPPQATCEASDM
jgi:hypothetical protein